MDRPKIGIGVIVWKNDKFLLGKRKNAHGEDTWSFPGGHLEYGESWTDCAKREVEEETNLKIKNLTFFDVTNDVFYHEKKHYVTIFMASEYESGELKNREPDKCDQWVWADWEHLPENLFLPIVDLLKQRRN